MASYTVPIDGFDTQALADDCRSQPGCSAVFIMPELPAYGTMYTEYRVELKEYSESEWVSVDPPAGMSVEDMCLGTMVDDHAQAPTPDAQAPPSEGAYQQESFFIWPMLFVALAIVRACCNASTGKCPRTFSLSLVRVSLCAGQAPQLSNPM